VNIVWNPQNSIWNNQYFKYNNCDCRWIVKHPICKHPDNHDLRQMKGGSDDLEMSRVELKRAERRPDQW
jgi:hypothetical protein